MAPAQGRENVAVFNPIVLALPNWHPDGPDGDVDGYIVPFVFPDERTRQPNRRAHIRVYPTEHGWRAALRSCQDHADTADQARAFAGAWIRAAEVLDAVASRAAAAARLSDDDVVDAEVVEDDEDQDARDFEVVYDDDDEGQDDGKLPPDSRCPACQHGTCTLHRAAPPAGCDGSECDPKTCK